MDSLKINKTIQQPSVEPFLKWAGGKRWLTRRNAQIIPPKYSRYIEPFLGSAAIFFSEPQTPFILSDINADLINCYVAIRDSWPELENKLYFHQKNHSDEHYYRLRSSEPDCSISRAARFIYLNRTCWNGLYRVNLAGKFNVPRGTKDKVVMSTDNFKEISQRLTGGSILCCDFEDTLSQCGKGDFIFIDPPYTVNHNNNGFLKYNEKIFSWQDQERLKEAAHSAADRGALITITNASHASIRNLYSEASEIQQLDRKSCIAGSSAHRGSTSEVLIRIGWKTSSKLA